MATDIEIFIGTSQDFLLSFKVKKADNENFVMERFIAHRSHSGSIISMDTSGRYLATGGGDDRIVIIDLKLNRDVQEIIRHEGSVNSVLFTNDGSHLLSCSEDGRLIATKVGSWIPENIWKKPHTGKAVLKVCIHESGKFALTLGKDGTLRGWDMLKGTQMNTSNVKDFTDANIMLDNIELCPNGNTFAMSGEKTVTITSFTTDTSYDEVTLKSRVTSLCWIDNENLLIGMENGSIQWTNINDSKHVNIPDIHKRRIKGMHYLNGFLGTICSTGDLSLWSTTISKRKLTLICTTNDESMRPTCIKLIDTTLNRFKEEVSISTADSAKNVQKDVEKIKPISTTGKVVIEMDGNENDKLLSPNWKLEVSDDTDTEVVASPKRKTPKKKKASLSDDEVPQINTPTQNSQTSAKKKKAKVNGTKPIVVRSIDSDDDFEQSSNERKRSSQKLRKKNTSFDETELKPRKLKLKTAQSQANLTGQVKNNMFLNNATKKFKSQQESTPKNTKATKTSVKMNSSQMVSSHVMSTRKKKRKTL